MSGKGIRALIAWGSHDFDLGGRPRFFFSAASPSGAAAVTTVVVVVVIVAVVVAAGGVAVVVGTVGTGAGAECLDTKSSFSRPFSFSSSRGFSVS